jgi:putative transcriptional regulator
MKKVELGNRLKVARAERDLSQEDLAKMAEVSRQTICSIETGQYCPSTMLAFILAKRLGTSVEKLFYLKEIDRE